MVHLGKGKTILQAPNRKDWQLVFWCKALLLRVGSLITFISYISNLSFMYQTRIIRLISITAGYNIYTVYIYVLYYVHTILSVVLHPAPHHQLSTNLFFCRASDLQVDQLCKGLRQTICHSLAGRMLMGICRSWQLLSIRYHIMYILNIT